MQQGVVDGTDAVNVVMTGGKLFEVAKFYTEVGLNYRAGILLMNQGKFNALDEETKSTLVKVIDENTKYYNGTIYPEYEIQAKQMMRDNGVEIIEAKDVNRDPFVRAVQSVYDKNQDRFDAIVEKIKALE
jgi:TRAP-type C4-dicarboxylate transport system substrate-binding protein